MHDLIEIPEFGKGVASTSPNIAVRMEGGPIHIIAWPSLNFPHNVLKSVVHMPRIKSRYRSLRHAFLQANVHLNDNNLPFQINKPCMGI